MKTPSKPLVAILLAAQIASPAAANEQIDFAEIWGRVSRNAPSLRAAQHESDAARIAKERSSRHWYPRVYTTMRAYSTNDPAASFMGVLEQRQIGAADFSPSSLNEPGTRFFEQASLGVDLPLYQGGMQVAGQQIAEKEAQAKTWEAKAVEINEYARAAGSYAALLVLKEQRTQLQSLRDAVSAVANNYSIGAKTNPVGYSGLLGLKTLRNRLDGLLAENEAKFEASRTDIRALAGELPGVWSPKSEPAKSFLEKSFPVDAVNGMDRAAPASVQAARLGAEALGRAKEMEKARFLPRVGLFAQGDLFSGNRASATGYTTGAYLQWDLFSAPNFGAVEQAAHQAAAAEARARVLESELNGGRAKAEAAIRAAEKNIELLGESAVLLAEQAKAARTLFLNGSINALQLAEVFNRHADLLVQRAEAELVLTKLKAALYLATAREGAPL